MQNNLLEERSTNLHYQMQFLKDDFCNRSRFHEEYIEYLKHRINEEDNKEKQILHYIQQKANVSVVLRYELLK